MTEQDQSGTAGDGAYCFRVPFRMAPESLLDLPEPTHALAFGDGGVRVWLAAVEPKGPLRDALRLAIRGEGYESESSAREAGEHWRDIVSRALARLHLAADFGDRRATGGLTAVGGQWYAEQVGHPVKAEVPGVTTFRSDPNLKFVRSQADACRRPSPEQSVAVFDAAATMGSHRLSPAERLAFTLYSNSFFLLFADARLVTLMMAIETLLDPQPRSPAAQAQVQTLIEATAAAVDLSDAERRSLTGSLSRLRNESISQAGRKLAKRLEPRTYGGRNPSAFFTRCYDVRSALVHVHGRVPPDRAEVDLLAADLEVFVGHLLSGDLIDTFDTEVVGHLLNVEVDVPSENTGGGGGSRG